MLLDGAREASDLARRAYVLFDPFDVIRVEAESDRGSAATDPFHRLFASIAAHGCEPDEGPSRFRGGAAGFLAYDLGRHLERWPTTASRSTGAPDLWFGLFDRGLDIDLHDGSATLFVRDDDEARARSVFAAAERRLAAPLAPLAPVPVASSLRSNFTRDEYLGAVEEVRERIRDGEVYQVNLSQRFEGAFRGDPLALYGRLRQENPAPFAAYVDAGDVQVLSSSPERFVRRRGSIIETRPIKGTRPRSGRPDDDLRAVAELSTSSKEAAELAMIVDLERNDFGRVAEFGSVEVVDAARIETYATVFHRVATVRARLRAGVDSEALLRATFPGGSITGAPKLRAIEVIEEIERTRRGVFCGSIGWIGFDGDLDLNIAIRTIVRERDRVHFHVGGGVVLDSSPAAEHHETLVKGAALARALGVDLFGAEWTAESTL